MDKTPLNHVIEGRWWHWNHEYIPPWDKNDHHVYPTGAHSPPLDIGANFYPSVGAYRCGNYLKQSANGNLLPFIFCCSAQEIHWCWRNIWQWPPRLGPAYLQCLGTVSSHIRPRCLIVHLLPSVGPGILRGRLTNTAHRQTESFLCCWSEPFPIKLRSASTLNRMRAEVLRVFTSI